MRSHSRWAGREARPKRASSEHAALGDGDEWDCSRNVPPAKPARGSACVRPSLKEGGGDPALAEIHMRRNTQRRGAGLERKAGVA